MRRKVIVHIQMSFFHADFAHQNLEGTNTRLENLLAQASTQTSTHSCRVLDAGLDAQPRHILDASTLAEHAVSLDQASTPRRRPRRRPRRGLDVASTSASTRPRRGLDAPKPGLNVRGYNLTLLAPQENGQ